MDISEIKGDSDAYMSSSSPACRSFSEIKVVDQAAWLVCQGDFPDVGGMEHAFKKDTSKPAVRTVRIDESMCKLRRLII